jgi:NOL1/NOP2/sun family putative RNA methylase
MKELLRSVASCVSAIDDPLNDIFSAQGKEAFLSLSPEPLYLRLPLAAPLRVNVLSWLKGIDAKAEVHSGVTDMVRVSDKYRWGSHLRYYLGDYYPQSLASLLPVLILDPQADETILDIAAAPGSKTTAIAERMKNSGRLVANDSKRDRLQALSANLDRMGVYNCAVTNLHGDRFGTLLPNFFDRVLADVPCSSIGAPGKWASVKDWLTPRSIRRLLATQIALLTSAVKACKEGGIIVYSTCTLNPLENELVVDWALNHLPVQSESVGADFHLVRQLPLRRYHQFTFTEDVGKAVKISPLTNPTEGFFIARLRKTSSSKVAAEPLPEVNESAAKNLRELVRYYDLQLPDGRFWQVNGDKIWMSSGAWRNGRLPFALRSGLKVAERRDRMAWRFTPAGAQRLGASAGQRVFTADDEEMRTLLAGHALPTTIGDGYYLLLWRGRSVSYGYVQYGKMRLKIGRPYSIDDDFTVPA